MSPEHIAIIMDGNGRWALGKNLPRIAGHRQGINRVKEIIKAASESGIKVLTLFAFSTENWSRPKKEIDMLMRYLEGFLNRHTDELHKKGIKLKVVGVQEPLPGHILQKIKDAEDLTSHNTGMQLVLALNYGSRQEIVDAARAFAKAVHKGSILADELTSEKFAGYLYTAGLPDPDLLIRTSGEMRLSNFLLWQLSYTELYFVKKYWPEFTALDFKKAISAYKRRKRRFGGVKDAY